MSRLISSNSTNFTAPARPGIDPLLARYRECALKYLSGTDISAGTVDPSHIGVLFQMARCLNSTDFQAIESLRDSLAETKTRELPLLVGIITVYTLLALCGSAGNGLVIFTIWRGKRMRTEHNFYICNLAVSDFILCAVTQPLNALRLMQNYISWEYGTSMCRIVNMLTGLNMFVSTFSITAVAVDRCRTIASMRAKVPTVHRRNCRSLLLSLLAIWGSATLAASPLAVFPTVIENPLHKPPVKMCIESASNPLINWSKLIYSAGSVLVQYLLPLAIVLVAYFRIYKRLRHRMSRLRRRSLSLNQRNAEVRRQRRANWQLLAISLTFCLSWLPLSIVNIVQECNLLKQLNKRSTPRSLVHSEYSTSTFGVVAAQSVPLVLVLVSACLNPVFYGWLNDNFQAELMRLTGRIPRTVRHHHPLATSAGQNFSSDARLGQVDFDLADEQL